MSRVSSEFCISKMSTASLLIVLFSIHFVRSTHVGCPYLTPDVCSSLAVGHGVDVKPSEPSAFSFSLRLVDKNTEEIKSCYNLNTEYYIRLKTGNDSMKGFIMVQDADKQYGEFPTSQQTLIPQATRRGLCRPSGMPSVHYSCRGADCPLYSEIRIPYTSPSVVKPVEFRYSVVFSVMTKFIQNKTTIFRPCASPTPKPTIKPTTAPPAVCNASEFYTGHNPQPVQQNCRNNVTYINSTVHKEGDNTYDCKYVNEKNPRGVKRVDCFTGCNHDKDGRRLCCRVKIEEYVNRTFSCTLRNAENPITEIKTLQMLQLRRCECFYCDDVCSVRPPVMTRENSVEYDSKETNRVERRR